MSRGIQLRIYVYDKLAEIREPGGFGYAGAGNKKYLAARVGQ